MDSNPTCVKQAMPKQAVLWFRILFSSRSLWRHRWVCIVAKGTLTHVFVEVREQTCQQGGASCCGLRQLMDSHVSRVQSQENQSLKWEWHARLRWKAGFSQTSMFILTCHCRSMVLLIPMHPSHREMGERSQ